MKKLAKQQQCTLPSRLSEIDTASAQCRYRLTAFFLNALYTTVFSNFIFRFSVCRMHP